MSLLRQIGCPSPVNFSGGRALPGLPLTAVCVSALALSLMAGPASSDVGDLAQTAEWRDLARVWHALTDHSSDLVYNPTLLRELAGDMEKSSNTLMSMSAEGQLADQVAKGLRRLFDARYEYLRTYHYADEASVTLTGAESSRVTARWIIELQLAVLRRVRNDNANHRLAEAAQSNIAYQLSFLHHSDRFEAEVDRRGRALKEREEAGETVNWDAFTLECHRRRTALLEAYRQKKLRRPREVERLMPYVTALSVREQASLSAAKPTGTD
jgi:hypothetical protein